MTREVITIFSGQAGCQMGNAIWELLCAEHGIHCDGTIAEDVVCNQEMSSRNGAGFFYQSNNKRLVPRAIFSDLEDLVISEIRHGRYRGLFHPDFLVHGKEDAASIFARGYHSIGQTKIECLMEAYRSLLENCECVSGLMTVHSTGGGTGSGFSSLIIDQLREESPKTTIVDCTVCPSGLFASNTVEPYNALLASHYTMTNVDVSFMWDNDALYYVSSNRAAIASPTFNSLNRLTSQIFSSMTACLRYGGDLCSHITDYQTNLVPYPRLHFPITSYAPVCPSSVLDTEAASLGTMTKMLFKKDHMLSSCQTDKGKYISCCLMYRGAINPVEIYHCIKNLKNSRRMRFVDWCPTGMKISICGMPPVTILGSGLATTNKNVMMMTNNSAIGQIFDRLKIKFQHLYQKRAFLFWFVGDGMEEGEFKEAVDDINALVTDYQQAGESTNPEEDETIFHREKAPTKKQTSNAMSEPSGPPVVTSASKPSESEVDISQMKKDVEKADNELEYLQALNLEFSEDEDKVKPGMSPLQEEPETPEPYL